MYFGERSRTGSTLLADALLDMYGRRRTRLSILMRGAQGFGAKHRLRTDRLLTLSEDLPAVAIAIDTRERIAALRHDVQALIDKGLVTLGRTCLVDDRQLPDALTEGDETLKLSAYVGRHERIGSRPAFAAICELLYEQGIAGASVLLGVDGTRDGHRERARFFARNERVPLMILAVGDGARLIGCVAELQRLQPSALFTLERMRVCKRDGELLRPIHGVRDCVALATPVLQKLTVVTSEAARHRGRPIHVELVRRLRAMQLAGATSLRGIWGFHGRHAPHGDKLLTIRRHVPVITTVIDAPERIARAFALIDELTSLRGLVTSELLPANISVSRGCSSVG